MTPGQWKALLERVLERSTSCTGAPGPHARWVLVGLLRRLARGVEMPSQEAFAAQLGLGERQLRSALWELGEAGLVFYVRRGSRPAAYEVDPERVRAWASGELIVEQDLHHKWDENGTTTEPLWDQNSTTTSRAQGHGGGGGDPEAAAEVAAAAARDRELADVQKAAVQACRSSGVPMPYTMQQRLKAWLAKGLQLEDVQEAAEQAALNGAKGFGYVERILNRMYADGRAVAGQPLRISDYRPHEPWEGE